ncbi:unnamed protein product [Rhizophagus irregularis]|nr:unnamed protein product [Rhizophagus irregularis]
MFEEADKEIPNISTSYEMNPDAIYISRKLTFIKSNDENDDDDDDEEIVASYELDIANYNLPNKGFPNGS